MTRSRASAKKAGSFVRCNRCGEARFLKHPKLAGGMCRRCASQLGSRAAEAVNRSSTADKFAESIAVTDNGCWLWIGHRYTNGYGAITHNGRQVLVHRWSYEHHVGPIPAGLQIDHLCRNRACANPGHLEPVTALENTRRAMRSKCVNGHQFSAENTYMHGGKRYCRTCRRERNAARYVAK